MSYGDCPKNSLELAFCRVCREMLVRPPAVLARTPCSVFLKVNFSV